MVLSIRLLSANGTENLPLRSQSFDPSSLNLSLLLEGRNVLGITAFG